MRARSVQAVVLRGDNHGQHFPLTAAQRRPAKHDRAVKIHRGFHGAGILAHDTHHIPNSAGAFDGVFILPFQQAGRFFQRKYLYPGHKQWSHLLMEYHHLSVRQIYGFPSNFQCRISGFEHILTGVQRCANFSHSCNHTATTHRKLMFTLTAAETEIISNKKIF